jgi:hypothetical protein
MPTAGDAQGWHRTISPYALILLLLLVSGAAGMLRYSRRLPVVMKNSPQANIPVRKIFVQPKQVEVLHEERKPQSGTQPERAISSEVVTPAKLIVKQNEEPRKSEPTVKMMEPDVERVEVPAPLTPDQLISGTEDAAREKACELEVLNTLKNAIHSDIQKLDFKSAGEKLKAEDFQFSNSLAVTCQSALAGLLVEAEGFHLWLSSKVVGFRFSRGGIVERSDRQSIRFAGASMPWQTFYLDKTELVGDMINNLVLSAMATQDLAIEEKGLLLIQTSAFLALYYPEKAYASDKTEEILALVLESCTNHVAKVQSLFPIFYSSYTNGTYLAKLQSRERSRDIEEVEKRTAHVLKGPSSPVASSTRPASQMVEPPTEAAAIKKATVLVNQTLSAYPAALEARYVMARPCFQSFMGENLKRFTPRLILTFNFRYRTPSGRERWNPGPVNVAYDTEEKKWVMMGFSEATITGQNFLDTQEGQQAVQVAVKKAVRTSGDSNGKNSAASSSIWKRSDLRSYDSRHPRNK